MKLIILFDKYGNLESVGFLAISQNWWEPRQHRRQQHWQGWKQFGMTGACCLPRYDWCDPLSHSSSCMLVNHGPSQHSPREEYKPWKWDATVRYYASRTEVMKPTIKSMPRTSRQLTTRRLQTIEKRGKLKWYGHVSRSSGLAKTILRGTVKRGRRQGKRRRRDGKTISFTGQAWSSPSPKGQWR